MQSADREGGGATPPVGGVAEPPDGYRQPVCDVGVAPHIGCQEPSELRDAPGSRHGGRGVDITLHGQTLAR
ncbi:hypothetical protein GCM10009756_22860 [Pseudokineococcus marinus]